MKALGVHARTIVSRIKLLNINRIEAVEVFVRRCHGCDSLSEEKCFGSHSAGGAEAIFSDERSEGSYEVE